MDFKNCMGLVFCIFVAPLSSADISRIVTSEEPPTNYYINNGRFTGINGHFTGISTDVVTELQKHLELDVKIEVLPWARAFSYAKNKKNIAIFTAAQTQERIDHGFHFIGPIIFRKYVLWRRKDSEHKINSIEDIKDKDLIVGAMRGDWRSKYLQNNGINVQEVTSHAQGVKMLLAGRIDIWALSILEASPNLTDLGIEMSEIEMAYAFKEGSSYIMLSRDTPSEVVERWRKAFAEMQKTDFFIKTSKKWSDLLGFDIGYAEDKGFFKK